MKNPLLIFVFIFIASEATAQNTEKKSSKSPDSTRGCCVWKTDKGNKCVVANHGYCRTKANKANISFEFYAATRCEHISFCPIKNK